MAERTRIRTGVAIAAGILALGVLTGCTGDGGQSRTDACIIVSEGLEAVQAQVAQVNADLASGDVLSVAAGIDEITAALDALEPEVTNTEVKPILTDLTASFESVREAVVNAGTDDADAANEALDAAAADLQDAALRFNEVCGS